MNKSQYLYNKFQYYVHFTRNSYFLIVVPHIFWVRIFTLRAISPPPCPLTKGQGGRCPLRPPFPASLYVNTICESIKVTILIIFRFVRRQMIGLVPPKKVHVQATRYLENCTISSYQTHVTEVVKDMCDN